MKFFSDCSGPCELCSVTHGCIAGHGDDLFSQADDAELIRRLKDPATWPATELAKWYDPTFEPPKVDYSRCLKVQISDLIGNFPDVGATFGASAAAVAHNAMIDAFMGKESK